MHRAFEKHVNVGKGAQRHSKSYKREGATSAVASIVNFVLPSLRSFLVVAYTFHSAACILLVPFTSNHHIDITISTLDDRISDQQNVPRPRQPRDAETLPRHHQLRNPSSVRPSSNSPSLSQRTLTNASRPQRLQANASPPRWLTRLHPRRPEQGQRPGSISAPARNGGHQASV